MKSVRKTGCSKNGPFKPAIETGDLIRLSLDALAGLGISLSAGSFEAPLTSTKVRFQPERRTEHIRKNMPGSSWHKA